MEVAARPSLPRGRFSPLNARKSSQGQFTKFPRSAKTRPTAAGELRAECTCRAHQHKFYYRRVHLTTRRSVHVMGWMCEKVATLTCEIVKITSGAGIGGGSGHGTFMLSFLIKLTPSFTINSKKHTECTHSTLSAGWLLVKRGVVCPNLHLK